jgi:hypothetical protein
MIDPREELEAIVRDLATLDPTRNEDGTWRCLLCDAEVAPDSMRHRTHYEHCVWRRAVLLIEQQLLAGSL